jgi:predicted esterase YcpF (UPF0227 family)
MIKSNTIIMNQLFNIYYVHGLGSSNESKKFKILSQKYEGIKYLEWNENENLGKYVDTCVKLIINNATKNNTTNIIISSDIGSNIALQMKHKLFQIGLGVTMIMINPLLKIKQLFNIEMLSRNLSYHLYDVSKLTDALIIIADNDTLINNKKIPKKVLRNNTIVEVMNNTYKSEDLKECLEDIDLFIISRFFSK